MLDWLIANFNVRVATMIQRPGTWIKRFINYSAVLAKWRCARKKLAPHV